MEHFLLLLIMIFQVLLFFLCRHLVGKEIALYLLTKRFRSDFSSSLGDVEFELTV